MWRWSLHPEHHMHQIYPKGKVRKYLKRRAGCIYMCARTHTLWGVSWIICICSKHLYMYNWICVIFFQESKENVVARQDLNELDLSLGLKSHDDDDSDSRTEDAKDGEELERVNSGIWENAIFSFPFSFFFSKKKKKITLRRT